MRLLPAEKQELDAMRAPLEGPGSDPYAEAVAAHAARQAAAAVSPASAGPSPAMRKQMWAASEGAQVETDELEATQFGTGIDPGDLTLAESLTAGVVP